MLDAGDEESGCTIHQVTEAVDGGPIVVQKKVKVNAVYNVPHGVKRHVLTIYSHVHSWNRSSQAKRPNL